jgi:hypothetical protein
MLYILLLINVHLVFFYVHVTMHHNKFLFNKTNRRTDFPNLFLSRNSKCFGQFLCPSSGVFHCTFSTAICQASLTTSFKHDLVVLESASGKSVRLLVLLKRKFTLCLGSL